MLLSPSRKFRRCFGPILRELTGKSPYSVSARKAARKVPFFFPPSSSLFSVLLSYLWFHNGTGATDE